MLALWDRCAKYDWQVCHDSVMEPLAVFCMQVIMGMFPASVGAIKRTTWVKSESGGRNTRRQ